MTNAYNDTATLTALIKAAYDKYVFPQLRSDALFRQFVDVRPEHPAMDGSSITLQINKGFANLATTPLTENVTPDSVADQNPSTVTLTPAEYGNWTYTSFKFRETTFVPFDPRIAQDIVFNMVDTMDVLVRGKLDASTRQIAMVGSTITPSVVDKTASVTSSSPILGKTVAAAVTKLRGDLAPPMEGNDYALVLHPNVSYDLRSDTANTGWLVPASYSAADRIWNGEVGKFAGARVVESPRCKVAGDGASSASVYRGYALGREAIAEVVSEHGEPQVVVTPPVDPLQRLFTIGWKGYLGWSLFRPESARLILTSSGLPADATS